MNLLYLLLNQMNSSKTTSNFGELLSYLETEQKNTKERKSKGVPETSTSIDTKKVIQESLEDIHADVSFHHPAALSSRGFIVQEFESLMRAKLIDEYKRLQSYERPYISVTEILSCIRQKYYTRLKYAINIKDQYSFSYLYLINKVGNVVHDIIQDLYNFTEVEKTIISEEYKTKGRIDAIRDNFLYEIKTIDARKFKDVYIDNHYHQSIVYSYILNNEYNYKIDTCVIVYVIRDLKKIIPFDLPVNDDTNKIAKKFLGRSILLKNSIDRKIVPDPIGADKEQCNFCPYKKFCERDTTELDIPFLIKKNKSSKPDRKKKQVFMI